MSRVLVVLVLTLLVGCSRSSGGAANAHLVPEHLRKAISDFVSKNDPKWTAIRWFSPEPAKGAKIRHPVTLEWNDLDRVLIPGTQETPTKQQADRASAVRLQYEVD